MRRALIAVFAALAAQSSMACGTNPKPEASPAPPPAARVYPLEGTEWRVVQLGERPVEAAEGARVPTLTLTPGPEGRASGSTGCNTYNGSYSTSGGRLVLGGAATTRMACIGAAGNLEQEWLAVMQKLTAYRLRGSVLELFDGDRKLLARLEAAAP